MITKILKGHGSKPRLWLALIMAALLFAGCSHWKPFKPPVASEIPEGPGLFSGEDGEFVIYWR